MLLFGRFGVPTWPEISSENAFKLGQVGPSWAQVGPTWAQAGPIQRLRCKLRCRTPPDVVPMRSWVATCLNIAPTLPENPSHNEGLGGPNSNFSIFFCSCWPLEAKRAQERAKIAQQASKNYFLKLLQGSGLDFKKILEGTGVYFDGFWKGFGAEYHKNSYIVFMSCLFYLCDLLA